MMRYAKEGVGEAMVDIIGSIGNLTLDLHNDKTCLANYSGIAPTMRDPQAISDKIAEVRKETADLTGREGMYVHGMLNAFDAFTRVMAGDDVKYIDAINAMQQIRMRPIPDARYQELAAKIGDTLGGMGYTGSFMEQTQAFMKDTLIPPDEVTKVGYQFL